MHEAHNVLDTSSQRLGIARISLAKFAKKRGVTWSLLFGAIFIGFFGFIFMIGFIKIT